MSLDSVDVINARRPSPALITGGQPSPAQLRAAAQAGVQHVINLRPASEDAGFDEDAEAVALALNYTRIPVAGAQDLTREKVEALDRALAAAGAAPTLVHCASGNRVGALMALRAAWLKGCSIEQALDIGRAHGLTTMEPQIRAILSAPPGNR